MTCITNPIWALCHLGIRFPLISAVAVSTYIYVGGDPGPMVAVTFDDGRKTVASVALPYMKERGVVGTSYVTTDFISEEGRVDVPDLQRMVVAGWEIGSHGMTHEDMTTLSAEDLSTNLRGSKDILKEISKQSVASFASPYGSYNDATLGGIKKTYANHVDADHGKDPNLGLNLAEGLDPYQVKRWDLTSDVTAAEVCERIRTLPDDSLYVILFHDVRDDVVDKYVTRTETFEDIINCIYESGVDNVTVTQGVERLKNK